MKRIPYGKQHINSADIKAVSRVLASEWLTQGPDVRKFEDTLASFCGAKYAVAVSSGTAALHIAVLASGLGEGDEAVTTPVTFLATPNSIVYSGAKPVFADINYGSVNISAERIEEKITPRTRAVLPVHFAGLPADMPAINRIAGRHGLTVIEDACHALGAEYKYNGKWVKVGSSRHSDMTVFSFHPVKAITTGEGGAITTNSKRLYEKLISLRSHGTYKDEKTSRMGLWYYEMRDLGFNYRITDIQCALGTSQLKKTRSFISKRKKIADAYKKGFKGMQDLIIEPQTSDDSTRSAWHLYVLRINTKNIRCSRKKIFEKLTEKGIGVQVHYIPVYKQPFYVKKGYSEGIFPYSEKYYKEAISLPIFPDLKKEQIEYVVDTVRSVLLSQRR